MHVCYIILDACEVLLVPAWEILFEINCIDLCKLVALIILEMDIISLLRVHSCRCVKDQMENFSAVNEFFFFFFAYSAGSDANFLIYDRWQWNCTF